MANKRDIRRRIQSVMSTQKITNAMKLVASAKFAKAAQMVVAARPYNKAFSEMVEDLINDSGSDLNSPFMENKEEKRVLLIVAASDRGLCGSINTNLFKHARNWMNEKKEKGIQVDTIGWGQKAINFLKKQPEHMISETDKVLDKPTYQFAAENIGLCCSRFLSADYDHIYMAFCEFKSALSQDPVVKQILPISMSDVMSSAEQGQSKIIGKYVVEPSFKEMLDMLLRRKMTSVMFQALLEAAASEQGARMTAMDNATSNATELNKKLVLQYNRARQAAITNELIEIVAGAQAL